jgi:hypothetical protein
MTGFNVKHLPGQELGFFFVMKYLSRNIRMKPFESLNRGSVKNSPVGRRVSRHPLQTDDKSANARPPCNAAKDRQVELNLDL